MVSFAGIVFRGLTLGDVFADRVGLAHIVTVNAEYIVQANNDVRFRRIVNAGIATFDGQVPYLVARLMNMKRTFSKISGSELIYHICNRAAQQGEKVFLLGGEFDSNNTSVEVLGKQYPGLQIAGFSPPFEPYPFSDDLNEKIFDTLSFFKPHYLLVGFGIVKQDYWIDDNRKKIENIGIRLVVGVGGTFDMVSGYLKRAPKVIQVIGLEGFYRLIKEPKLFRAKRLVKSINFIKYIF